jgi:saccharopine dehydrogenase-like NADP-dependent oxidoreductase
MKQKKILVLGAGHIGNAIARDLKQNGHDVTAVDLNMDSLQLLKSEEINILREDFTDIKFLQNHLKDKDLVIGAAPGKFGFSLMNDVIDAGKDMVDISFCPEDYMKLDSRARKNKVCIVPDAGVAPGMCNIILGYHYNRMKVRSYKCLVGGLPVKRIWPLEYKASWSPVDVIEEYTRPARFRKSGKLITRPALSDAELVDIDPIGTLEEWNSDGLRSLLKSMPDIPDMVEKTLRYPGTINYLKAIRELGFFSEEEIELRGKTIRPLDLSAHLLQENWRREKGEREFTVMRVIIEGQENQENLMYVYDLYDEYDPGNDMLSMARTTGYTCTAIAELLLKGKHNKIGVNPPEYLGEKEANFKWILDYLESRNVVYRQSRTVK